MQTTTTEEKDLSTVPFVLGLVGAIAWLIPLFGFPVTIVGLIKGCTAKRLQPENARAHTAVVLNIIFLSLTAVSSAIGIMFS